MHSRLSISKISFNHVEEMDILWFDWIESRTTKLHGRPTRKYDKIMWRAIKQMWGTTEVYNIFPCGLLQKLEKLIGF